MKYLVLFVVLLLIHGCTSATKIMQGYVGKQLSEAIIGFGPPTTSFEMGDGVGTRAFIWRRDSSFTSPGYSNTYGNASIYATGNTANIYGTQSTTFTPPQTSNWTCYYTAFAKRTRVGVEGPAAWTVTGFKKPTGICE